MRTGANTQMPWPFHVKQLELIIWQWELIMVCEPSVAIYASWEHHCWCKSWQEEKARMMKSMTWNTQSWNHTCFLSGIYSCCVIDNLDSNGGGIRNAFTTCHFLKFISSLNLWQIWIPAEFWPGCKSKLLGPTFPDLYYAPKSATRQAFPNYHMC